ncbi:MAG: PAS domain-containing protein [Azospirillum sp.]|nr:PAS domain-containing protein [Azospirillum sp.]
MSEEVPYSPRLLEFESLWRSKCRGPLIPGRRDFAFEEFRPWLGMITLLEAVDGGADFRIALHGTANAERFRIDATGMRVSELPPQWRAAVEPGIAAVIAARAPVLSRHRWVNEQFDYAWERVLAPFASDGVTIDGLASVVADVSYKPLFP